MAEPPKKIKVIFLDCDGVVSPLGGHAGIFEKTRMALLKKLLQNTGAVIVLSSSWRTSDWGRAEVNKNLVLNAMPHFIGCTPDHQWGMRTNEIMTWIRDHQAEWHVENFVALDDINLPSVAGQHTDLFLKHAIVTNGVHGLTEQDITDATRMLGDANNIPADELYGA